MKKLISIFILTALLVLACACGSGPPAEEPGPQPTETAPAAGGDQSPGGAPPGRIEASAMGGDVELPILMYHHMLEDPQRWGDYVVSPECFEEDLKYLADRGYETVTPSQLSAWTRGEIYLPEKPVMITFDDGQESFLTYALPILKKYGMCAAMAIVGKYSDVYTQAQDHNINYSYLTWEQVGELWGSENVELAGHSYDMHDIGARKGCCIMRGESAADYAAALSADLELLESRFLDATGSVPRTFAYPFGAYCEEARQTLSDRGYTVLFTCNEHVNHLTGDPEELLFLGRFNRASKLDRAAFFTKIGIS